MDTKEVYDLIDRFEASDLTELTLKRGDDKLILKRGGEQTFVAPHPVAYGSAPMAGHGASLGATQSNVVDASPVPEGELFVAPIVGTFYRAASPDAPPYVEPGKVVKKGETLCIIEAMKSMNEIPAEYDCEILDVLVENGVSIEFDSPLFRVKPL